MRATTSMGPAAPARRRGRTLAGIGIALAGALACATARRPVGTVRPRNVILVSIDTLRADRLQAYGYRRATSPAIAALAARGVRFENVIAPANWTLPSHMTLFTGLAPSVHQVTSPWRTLTEDVRTLDQVLREHGYRTLGFTGGDLVGRRYGFGRGFERYEEYLELPDALTRATEAIREVKQDEKFFVFVHTYAVHCPYEPPPAYAAAFLTRPDEDHIETKGRCGLDYYDKISLTPGQGMFISDRYDASIRHADDLLGTFLDGLEERGTLADTLVVLLSDHGESFLEHGRIGHNEAQYMELLRIPWIMAGPGVEPRVVAQPAGLADVMPTLLDLLAIPAPVGQGMSLRPHLEGRTPAEPARTLFSESGYQSKLRSVVTGDYHLIVGSHAAQLYRWRDDPREQRNLAAADEPRASAMRHELESHLAHLKRAATEVARGPAAKVDETHRARLRALGYLE